MSWIRMSIDEYADLGKVNGHKLFKANDIWWKQVRPFFYRPFFPFVRIVPGSAKPPSFYFLGGVQHLVPYSDFHNSHVNLLIFDNVHEYSIDNLTHDYRKNIKKGLKNFVIKKIDDIDELMTTGHEAYLSFYGRTKYKWKNKRTDRRIFSEWAKTLFNFPKLLILGAYCNGVLSAVSISCLVEDVIDYTTFFCDTEALRLRCSEAMLHTIREMASNCKDARYIYMGMSANKRGLDDFKLSRGCKMISEPAYYWINPAVFFLAKRFRKEDHDKLIGMNEGK